MPMERTEKKRLCCPDAHGGGRDGQGKDLGKDVYEGAKL